MSTPPPFEPTEDAGFPLPEGGIAAMVEAYGEGRAFSLLAQREDSLAMMRSDPLNCGYEPESWRRADRMLKRLRVENMKLVVWMLVLGGNRAGKSEWAAKRVMEHMVAKPGARVWVLAQTESAARQTQMRYLWKYFPTEWKPESGKAKRGITQKISYTQAGGFSDNTFVLPNGSQCWFKFYASDVTTVEGTELTIAWADEEAPPEWVDAVAYRLANLAGHGLLTFTPISGYTPLVGGFLDNCRPEETVHSLALEQAGLPAEVVVAARCKKKTRAVVNFLAEENPYSNWPAILEEAINKSPAEIKMRCCGVPTKIKGARFPIFDEAVHVVSHETYLKLAWKKSTWWMSCDPCNGRNYFALYAAALPDGTLVAAREWPQEGDYIPGVGEPGPWAVTGQGKRKDGDAGEAQQPWNLGYGQMSAEFVRCEEGLAEESGRPGSRVDVWQRIMDSRFGATPTVTRVGTTTLIEQFAALGEGDDDPGGAVSMSFEPASGERQDEGLSMISDWLTYDRTKPVGPGNSPKLLVHERCTNLIFSLKHFTGLDGQKGACKDPLDCLRYLVLEEPCYVEPTGGGVVGGGHF